MSAVTRLTVYNMALGFLGTRQLASEREACPEAAQCALYFDRARRAAIRDYPYSFCRRRIRLGEVDLPEEYAGLWSHAYALPKEAVKIISLDDNAEFELGRCASGLVIFSNQVNSIALCAVDVPEPAEWDELFILACSYRLAMFIATPLLKNNPGKIQELGQLYASLQPAAQGQAASEGRSGKLDLEDWITARESW